MESGETLLTLKENMEDRKQTDVVVYDDIIEDSESDGEVFEGQGTNIKD